ncbi:MAG: glycosyltransferase family 4 protein [Bacteroidetes bacterium]|nr:glycosyltransferase family 4 protein [Bacteroidota bacterium]
MKTKKTILVLCDWFLPGYLAGGPIQSVAALTHHLADEFNFKIITSDTDFKSEKPYHEVKSNTWTNFQNREVYYISRENMHAATLEKLIRETPHDVLYLNSLFSKYFTIIPLQLKRKGIINSPLVLAPRGMLSDGAFQTKTFKKKLFLLYAAAIGLFKNITWQATSPVETAEIIRRIGPDTVVREASNLPNVPARTQTIEKKAGELKLCTVARICETKNILFAVEAIIACKAGRVELDVYGPVEDAAYWEKCQALAKDAPANISLKYMGSIPPSRVAEAISEHHVFFLPTRNENFGHGIVEAMLCGRPVIISDQTPWRQLHEHQAGYDLPLNDKNAFVHAIESYISMTDSDYRQVGENTYQYITHKLSIEHIRQAYIKLFS